MPKENPYLINNKKPVETVYEIKNETQSVVGDQTPSFEEFMENYQEGNLNYDDLSGGSVSEVKGYGPCSYSPYEVNSHKVAGKHIRECGSLNCSYYRRITYNRVGGTAGIGASVGAGVGFGIALFATPFTGGASLAIAAGLSTAASASAVGGTVLTVAGMTETRNGVENELRLKWENEELKQKIYNLQSELNEVKAKYKRGELSKYRLREIIREKEAKIRELESENRRISFESEERWRAIEKLEETIRELKKLL